MSNFFSSKQTMHVLERRNEDQLILRAGGLAGCAGLAFLILGFAFLAAGFYNPAGWFYGPFFLFVGFLTRFGPHTTVLDRKRGVLKIRRFHFRNQYLLSQIEDVRVVLGRSVAPVHNSSYADRSYQSFQIVLSLDNSYEGRMVLLENGDGALQNQYAREIAIFLKVPYFDERHQMGESSKAMSSATERRPAPASQEELERLENQDRWALKRAERKKKESNKQRRNQ